MLFLHLFDSSEAPAGDATGFLRRQTARQSVPLYKLQVGNDFVLQLVIEAPFAR
jgi:hypothetical protein